MAHINGTNGKTNGIVPMLKVFNATAKFINQGGKSLKWAFTKENPNGIPSLKKIKIKGVEQWDDSDLMEFLEEMVKNQILPKVKPAEENDVQEDVQLPF